MSRTPASRFGEPAEADVPDDIREIYESNQKKLGFIPNVFRAYAKRPEHFRAFMMYHDVLMKGPSNLTRAEREAIVVVVSSENCCQYCMTAHGAALRILGKDPILAEQIANNYDIHPAQAEAQKRYNSGWPPRRRCAPGTRWPGSSPGWTWSHLGWSTCTPGGLTPVTPRCPARPRRMAVSPARTDGATWLARRARWARRRGRPRRRRRPGPAAGWNPAWAADSPPGSPAAGSRCTPGRPRRSPARPAGR